MAETTKDKNLQILNALRSLYPERFSEAASISLLPNQGWFNSTYLLVDEVFGFKLILRLRQATVDQIKQYQLGFHWSPYFKEAWALQTVHLGVPVPAISIDDLGYFYLENQCSESSAELYAFMLQEHLPFETASERISKEERTTFMVKIGETARQVNATPVKGFGTDFNHHSGQFDCESWQEYLEREFDSYNLGRPIVQKIFPTVIGQKIRARLNSLAEICNQPSLFHRDFHRNWSNILVNQEKEIVGIIDWEFAGAGPATHCELASTIYTFYREDLSLLERREEFLALLMGYGFSLRSYSSNFSYDVEALVLLHALSAIAKYANLEASNSLAEQPWRYQQALKAIRLIDLILKRKQARVYIRNPLLQVKKKAA